MQRFYSLLILLVFISLEIKAQNITVQENLTDTQLVQTLFPSGSCMTPTNIRISGYQFNNNKKSYGYFRNTNSNFALTEGILITTGRAASAVGPNNSILSDGPTSWSGDRDLENAIRETSTFNATSIEFEIVALTDLLSFDYIFSSEQYLSNPGAHQCDYSDGFAFLVKEADNASATYNNIALIPGTNQPVKVSNVRARTNNCPESYVQYFGGFNGSNHPTNYNGQTKVLTARANVTPGVRYKFKLVVADQGNEKYDSAIFLSASSFRNNIDLGIDNNLNLCHGEPHTFTPTPIPNAQHYTWRKDGVIIPGYNQVSSPNLTVNEAGTYQITAFINNDCIITGEGTLQYKNPVIVNSEVVNICSFSSEPNYVNILDINSINFEENQADDLTFHRTELDAQNGTNAIEYNELINYLINPGENILYTRGYRDSSRCYGFGTFTVNLNNQVTNLPTINTCSYNGNSFNLLPYLPSTSNLNTLKLYANAADAQNGVNALNTVNSAMVTLQPGENIIYVHYNTGVNCGDKYVIKINNIIGTNLPDQTASICNSNSTNLTAPSGYTNYLWNTGSTSNTITVNTSGEYVVTLTSAEGCTLTQKFIVTVNNNPSYFNKSISLCVFSSQYDGYLVNLNQQVQSFITLNNTYKIYNSLVDAENDFNAISGNTILHFNQTFYVKESNVSGCFTISQLTININFANTLNPINICSINNSNTNIETIRNNFANNYPGKTILIYQNESDANANTNAITSNSVSASITTLFIKILDSNSTCYINFIQPLIINNVQNLPTQNVTICQNNFIDLQTITGDYTYLWNNGATTSSISVNSIGRYVVKITNANGCEFEQVFNVSQSQIAVIEDIKVVHFSNLQNSITVITSGSNNVEYSIDGINFQSSNIFYSVTQGYYTIYVRDINGCGIVTSKTLVLDIRNFFTPNADGIYDTWDVSNLFEVFPTAEIFIMDRFGKIMTYLYPDRPAWDGTHLGKAQPSTDYWYVIKLPNGIEHKGHFSLKR